MEYKVRNIKITDVRKYGLFGRRAMIINFDDYGNRTLVLGQGNKMRAFILYLIGEISRECGKIDNEGKTKKKEETENYKILENFLYIFLGSLLYFESEPSEFVKVVADFTDKQMKKTGKAKAVSKKKEMSILENASILERSMQEVNR